MRDTVVVLVRLPLVVNETDAVEEPQPDVDGVSETVPVAVPVALADAVALALAVADAVSVGTLSRRRFGFASPISSLARFIFLSIDL